jgi:hypothetical protein
MDSESELFEGDCSGGPLDGQPGQSRYPKGFLLVDKADNKAWVYDWNGSRFVVRDDKGAPVDSDGRMSAAESPDWDVRAYSKGDAK